MFFNLQAFGVNTVSTTANSIKKTYKDLYFYGESSLSNISLLNKIALQPSNANIDLTENQVEYVDSNDGNALLITLNNSEVKVMTQESITNAFNGLSFEYHNDITNGIIEVDEISNNLSFVFNNNISQDTNVEQTITKPIDVFENFILEVKNPSIITDLTVKVFNVENISGNINCLVDTFVIPKSNGIDNSFIYNLSGLFLVGDVKIIISNNTVLGISDGFTASINLKQEKESVDLLETDNIDVIIPNDYELEKQQSWIIFSNMMLADFKAISGIPTLEAGNFSSPSFPITHWRILRRIYKETEPKNVYTELDTFANNLTTEYYDYLSRSGVKYEYALQPISNGINLNYISEVSIVEFFGWKLESEETNISGTPLTSFSFDMEIETGNINTVTDITKLNNYSKYPLISRSLVEYEEGEITCMPYEIVSNDISVNNNILNSLKAFIHDGKTKILRNGSGRAWKVYTMDFNYKYNDKVAHEVIDNENNQPYTISFKWCQVGEVLE